MLPLERIIITKPTQQIIRKPFATILTRPKLRFLAFMQLIQFPFNTLPSLYEERIERKFILSLKNYCSNVSLVMVVSLL